MIDYRLKKFILITNELEENTFEDIEDYELALNELYETFEGYTKIKMEFDNWTIDENGDIIKRNLKETKRFYEQIKQKIYDMIIFNEFKEIYYNPDEEYDRGYQNGLYDAKSAILELELW